MNDSLLISDEVLTKYTFNLFEEEVILFLVKDEVESMSKFFELINSNNYTWDEISQIVFQMNPNVSYIVNTLAHHHFDKFKIFERDSKIEKILK